MQRYLISAFILILLESNCILCTPEDPLLTYEVLYNDGVRSYLDNNWGQCVKYFEFALEDYHWWRRNVIRCRKSCYEEADQADHIYTESSKDESFFERAIINTLCLVKCKKTVFGERSDIMATNDIDKAFEIKKPYDYLQLCYFKMGLLEEAANAAATVLAAQPEHEVMKTNLEHYVNMKQININEIKNLEQQDYAKEYIKGDESYTEEEYTSCITHMEKSFSLYLEELGNCRLMCEHPFNQGWYPDFISSIANHYTFTLRCKRRCLDKLSTIYDERIDNFAASYFNYLQFSYYKTGNLAKACEAVESFLALVPEDPIQLRNKQFFWSMQDVKEEYFNPRKDVLKLKHMIDNEDRLMEYIEVNFGFLGEGDPTSANSSPDQLAQEELPSITDSLADIINMLGYSPFGSSASDGPLREEL